MKWFILPAAAVFSLAVASPALAAPGTTDTGRQNAQPAHSTAIQLVQRDRRDRRDRVRDRRDRRNRAQDRRDRRGRAQVRRNRRRYDWGRYQPGRRPPAWRQHHRRFEARRWQRNFRSPRRYRWDHFRRPRGWYYRRWAFGAILPAMFWGRNYWINSYWNYGLIDPPYGYVWVRYGPDAMLVNVHTGVILRVVYSVFY